MHVQLAIIGAILLCTVGCKREDYSSPKAAALTFYYGIIKNKPQIAKNAVVDETQRAVVDEAKVLVDGLREVESAAEKQFGNASGGTGGGETVSSGLPQPEDLDAASEVIDGESASLVMKKAELKTLYFRKIKGEWKLDVLKSFGLASDKPDEAKGMVRTLGKAVKQVAGDIKGGKYKTAAEAKAALNSTMMVAVMKEKWKGWKMGG